MELVMLAGAPVLPALAEGMAAVTNADVRAPYGMTELMPLTDGRGAAAPLLVGTSTGRPLPGATVVITPFGRPDAASLPAGEWGEILANASWMRAGYDRRWGTDSDSTITRDFLRFHRSGDVGRLDHHGNLIQLGRAQHVITTASGPVPCVVIEQPLAELFGRGVAAVGIGPSGAQVIAVVLEAEGDLRLADIELTTRVRAGTETAVAAVLEGALPVDIRHQSKIRRDLLATEATKLLEGR
jgi:acyl-coenzyme A synthetase/AMP-(fatty) acid ligase